MDRVLKWRLVLEEYGLEIEYIQCKLNIVAYALLQLPKNGNQSATKISITLKKLCQKLMTKKNYLRVRFL